MVDWQQSFFGIDVELSFSFSLGFFKLLKIFHYMWFLICGNYFIEHNISFS